MPDGEAWRVALPQRNSRAGDQALAIRQRAPYTPPGFRGRDGLRRLESHHVTLLAVVLLVVATLFRLGLVELRGEEPRRAVVALEMLDSGQYVVPQMSGHTYYNKPPLFNWAVAASLKAFPGTEAWMVRLPSLLAFWLTGLLTFLVSRRFLDDRSAVWAALFYLTSGELLFYGSVMTGELDLFYSLIVFVQAVSVFWFLSARRWTLMFVASWALAALGFLTKGMPSLAYQVLTLVGALLAFRQGRRLFDPRHLIGLASFALIVGGYFYLYSLREPVTPFLVSLVEEASQRTGLESNFGELVRGTLDFPLVVFKLMLPWSLLAVWMVNADAWRRLWSNPWTRFCLVFCAVNMPLYWLSGELRNRYIYAFFPFVLVPVAHIFAVSRGGRPGLRRWTDRVERLVLVALSVSALVVPWIDPFRQFRGALLTGVVWALAGVGLVVLHRRREDLRIPVFVLALVVARLAFDILYLPAMNLSRVSGYPPHVERMVEIADGEPVFLAGAPEHLVRDASVGPIHLGEVAYLIPPSIAYQIPWHYARLTGRPMIWVETPEAGSYCLVSRAEVEGVPILLEFEDHWTGRELALVRWEE